MHATHPQTIKKLCNPQITGTKMPPLGTQWCNVVRPVVLVLIVNNGFLGLTFGLSHTKRLYTCMFDYHVRTYMVSLQVQKIMRTEYPEINHQYDIWHVAKSIFKKLLLRSRQSEHQDLARWVTSIMRHFWWSCASCDGNYQSLRYVSGQEIITVWHSFFNIPIFI